MSPAPFCLTRSLPTLTSMGRPPTHGLVTCNSQMCCEPGCLSAHTVSPCLTGTSNLTSQNRDPVTPSPIPLHACTNHSHQPAQHKYFFPWPSLASPFYKGDLDQLLCPDNSHSSCLTAIQRMLCNTLGVSSLLPSSSISATSSPAHSAPATWAVSQPLACPRNSPTHPGVCVLLLPLPSRFFSHVSA